MIRSALQSVLSCGNLPASHSDRVKFIGSDPVFRTRYRVGISGAAALESIVILTTMLLGNEYKIRYNKKTDIKYS